MSLFFVFNRTGQNVKFLFGTLIQTLELSHLCHYPGLHCKKTRIITYIMEKQNKKIWSGKHILTKIAYLI